jgi:hypothetical protein
MKKTLLLCGMLVALSASVASAAGVNIAWDNCVGGGGNHVKTFACASNAGNQTLYASAYCPPGMALFTGFSVEAYFGFTGAQTPWWQLRNQGTQVGQCRNGSMTVNADFTAAPGGCLDPFAGGAAGGIGTYQNAPGGDVTRARILIAFALPAGNEVPLDADAEYYAVKMTLNNAKTVGTGACAGCQTGTCINLTSVKFVQPAGAPGGDVDVTTPAVSNTAVWQASGDAACPGLPTPATRATWGSVKSLYR